MFCSICFPDLGFAAPFLFSRFALLSSFAAWPSLVHVWFWCVVLPSVIFCSPFWSVLARACFDIVLVSSAVPPPTHCSIASFCALLIASWIKNGSHSQKPDARRLFVPLWRFSARLKQAGQDVLCCGANLGSPVVVSSNVFWFLN